MLDRSFSMDHRVKLELLFDQPNALPTIPKVAKHLVKTLGSEDVSIADMTRQIESDPVLTAKLLRLTNSAYFGVPRKISSIEEAIKLLGFSTITTLIISTLVHQSFSMVPGIDLRPFWQYSLHTGTLARRLAGNAHVDQDVAFTAGLMHALGYLVMLSAMPDLVRNLDRVLPLLNVERCHTEQERFGFNFIEVTAELVTRWDFPPPLIAAIGKQLKAPLLLAREPVSSVLAMAVWRARCDALGMNSNEMQASFPDEIGDALSLQPDDMIIKLPSQKEILGPFASMLQ
jgi:HD-like signal output (HDOD) protein